MAVGSLLFREGTFVAERQGGLGLGPHLSWTPQEPAPTPVPPLQN